MDFFWGCKYHSSAIPSFMTCVPKVIFNNSLPSAYTFFKRIFAKSFLTKILSVCLLTLFASIMMTKFNDAVWRVFTAIILKIPVLGDVIAVSFQSNSA